MTGMRRVGIEPTRPFGHRDLNPARMPNFATAANGVSLIAGLAGPGPSLDQLSQLLHKPLRPRHEPRRILARGW